MATQQEIELSKAFGGTGTLTPEQQAAVNQARTAFTPMNINDANKSTFVPDFSLNPPTTPNTSGVIADANALTSGQLLTSEEYRKLSPQQKTQQKYSLIGNILSKSENKNTVGYMQELQQMQNYFLASKGYTQETFTQKNNFASQAQSLSNDLQRLNLEEKERIYQATGGFQLSGIKGAAENQIRREMAIQKAEVAYQLSVVTGQANLLQGQIDKANNLFEQALNYATAKEAQDVADWKFALEFYTDLDKEDRDYVQQQFENSLAIEANKRANAQLELDQMRTQYSMRGSEPKPIKLTGFGSRLQEAINSGLSPEQAARAVWAEDGVENYGVSWNDLVAEAMSLTGQAPVMEETGTGGEWMSPEAQVFGMGNFSNISINDRISQLKSMNFDKAMIRGQLREDGYPENEINRTTGNIIDKAAQAGSDLLSWVSKLFK